MNDYFKIMGSFGFYTIHYPSGQPCFPWKTFVFKFTAKRFAIKYIGRYLVAMNQIRNEERKLTDD